MLRAVTGGREVVVKVALSATAMTKSKNDASPCSTPRDCANRQAGKDRQAHDTARVPAVAREWASHS